MTTLIKAIPPTLPEGICDWQEAINYAFSHAQFVFQSDVGNSFYNYGAQVPSVENRIFPWFKDDGRRYDWNPNYGMWTSPYWPGIDCKFVLDWKTSALDLAFFDNPAGNVPVTPVAGPFWEVDPDFDAKMTVGAGTLPVSALLLTPGAIGGIDSVDVVLTSENLPLHRHYISIGPDTDADSYLPDQAGEAGSFEVSGTGGFRFKSTASGTVGQTRSSGAQLDGTTKAVPLDNMPPYKVTLKARRTARVFWVGG